MDQFAKNGLRANGIQRYRLICKPCNHNRVRAWTVNNRKLYNAKQARNNRKRYVVKLNLPHVAYDAQEIHERDAGVCMLCGFDVSSDDYHIEHVVPLQVDASLLLSYGILQHPGDVPWNVSVAHPSCNSSKGNRMRQEDAANYALLQYLYKE